MTTGAAMAALTPMAAGAASEVTLSDRLRPQLVRVRPEFRPGTIHITPNNHHLYYILPGGEAIRYGVAVGSEGRNFSGNAIVERKVEWPSWTPTPDMIEREPDKYAKYEDGMEGGPDNPLGARALYLYRNGQDTLYRIHGTPQPWTIGQSVSSGCIRMINDQVADLYKRVPLGTEVIVYA